MNTPKYGFGTIQGIRLNYMHHLALTAHRH